MGNTISVRFGAAVGPIHLQLGCRAEGIADIQALADAATVLRVADLLTESQVDRLRGMIYSILCERLTEGTSQPPQ